jgi:hypothetical protein
VAVFLSDLQIIGVTVIFGSQVGHKCPEIESTYLVFKAQSHFESWSSNNYNCLSSSATLQCILHNKYSEAPNTMSESSKSKPSEEAINTPSPEIEQENIVPDDLRSSERCDSPRKFMAMR